MIFVNDVTMIFEGVSGNSCNLTFKSDVVGAATTYANLYRRSLLQNVPCISVAGICCKYGEVSCKNIFEVVPGLTGSLVDINSKLHNAVFNIDTDDEAVIISVTFTGMIKLSDLCKSGSYHVVSGDIGDGGIELISNDSVLASVVGGKEMTLDIFLKRGVGYSPKDVNTQILTGLIGEDLVKNWIVTDSQHRGVLNVSYNEETRLGRQTITLGVKSYQDNIAAIVDNCTTSIIEQLSRFQKGIV